MNRNNVRHGVLNWNKILFFFFAYFLSLKRRRVGPQDVTYACCESPISTYEILARFSQNFLWNLIPPEIHAFQSHFVNNNNNSSNNMADANTCEVEGRLYNPYLGEKLKEVPLLGYGKPRTGNSDPTWGNPALCYNAVTRIREKLKIMLWVQGFLTGLLAIKKVVFTLTYKVLNVAVYSSYM